MPFYPKNMIKSFLLDESEGKCYTDNMKKIIKTYPQFQIASSMKETINFHVEKYVSGGYYAHFHHSRELFCVFNNSSRVFINNEEFTLTEGQAVFIDSLQMHSYECKDKSEVAFVLISDNYMQSFKNLYPDQTLPTFLSDPVSNRPLFDLIEKLAPKLSNFTSLESIAYSNLILHFIVSSYGVCPISKHQTKNYILTDVIRYIYNHSSESLSLSSLAAHFGYAPLTISKIFSQYVKIDIRNFINIVRLQKFFELSEMPQYKNMSIMQISSLCGFNSISSFYRTYNKSLNSSNSVSIHNS